MDEGRQQREREDGEDRENCRTEGGNLKPNNDLQLERWHRGAFPLFLSAGDERTHSLRAGMRSQTVCEKREAKRTDLFNELRRFQTKRKETHDTKMKTKISKYQKLKTKKRQKNKRQTERKALVHKDFLICQDQLTTPSCVTPHISVRISILLILSCRFTDHLFFYYFLFIAFLAKVDPTCKKSTYL